MTVFCVKDHASGVVYGRWSQLNGALGNAINNVTGALPLKIVVTKCSATRAEVSLEDGTLLYTAGLRAVCAPAARENSRATKVKTFKFGGRPHPSGWLMHHGGTDGLDLGKASNMVMDDKKYKLNSVVAVYLDANGEPFATVEIAALTKYIQTVKQQTRRGGFRYCDVISGWCRSTAESNTIRTKAPEGAVAVLVGHRGAQYYEVASKTMVCVPDLILPRNPKEISDKASTDGWALAREFAK